MSNGLFQVMMFGMCMCMMMLMCMMCCAQKARLQSALYIQERDDLGKDGFSMRE